MTYTEQRGNVFDSPHYYTLAHCISKDKALGAGIALTIRKRYPTMINKLNSINLEIGKAYGYTDAFEKRNIINLVTKDKYFEKPTYENLEQSLLDMKQQLIAHKIRFLVMPTIGCGLDKLEWKIVSQMIQRIFNDTNIDIRICFL